jgi:uncharacterized protein
MLGAGSDPALIGMLTSRMRDGHTLTLLRSERAMTDCRPVALFSIETARQLGDEVGTPLDKRRFRANVYLDLGDGFVGRALRLGSKVVVSILERDPRCKMITLDPDTAEANPDILRKLTRTHDGMAGVYGAVFVEGTVRRGRRYRTDQLAHAPRVAWQWERSIVTQPEPLGGHREDGQGPITG